MNEHSKTKTTNKGHLHPLTQTINDIVRIFGEVGFEVADGPEIESEYYNFDALNVPKDHPARDMHDTFWIKPESQKSKVESQKSLLRTHTSPVQIRYMETHKPPLKIIVPGRVFRNEATDATHEAQFYQVEGLAVGEDISMADLKGTLEYFFKRFFGDAVRVRFRPSFFPFVEPGAEVDISCFKCGGAGCGVCKHTGWIEILGAGMVHPSVLRGVGIDPARYSGFAFGGGVDRFAMLKYGVDDIRLFYSKDLRFINQF